VASRDNGPSEWGHGLTTICQQLQEQLDYLRNSQLTPLQETVSELSNGHDKVIETFREQSRKAITRQETALNRVEENGMGLGLSVDELGNKLKQREKELSQQQQSAQTAISELVDRTKSDVESFAEAHKSEIYATEPVKFWELKTSYHRERFNVWWRWLIGVAIASVLAIGYSWYWLFKDQAEIQPWRIGLFVTTGTVIIVVLRLLSRITMSHIHLASDADERVVMMKTYISLAHERELDKSQRQLMLQALFRPSTTSLVKEDAVPASMLDLATRVAGKSGGS